MLEKNNGRILPIYEQGIIIPPKTKFESIGTLFKK